ncbi:MAG: sugar ABC transporter ATP-binding protein [Verrucomicrobia bacterium]|jgi:rhamnose transport system ATP-binding protein|nr:sugar ABC transporter ATP-binding protein [Verrucomicrobiota bacterium]|tara:strand:+ start:72985 stop:74490 length:1506 start_codon:yes stop_codon:yes gene_type:complete
MPQTLLQLTNITKSFGAVRALKGVSFSLEAGEVHALLGENGAGKSTLVKTITGAHQADGGALEICGEVVSNLTPAGARELGIACVYQQPALFPDLSVAENISLRLEKPGVFSRVKWKSQRERAAELLKRIGAEVSPEAEVRSLSMPEQQLVEIACALGSGARIVIMDEPTASLTQKEQHLLFKVVRDLRENGVGVVYISHRLEEIFALADRVTVLRDGESVGTNAVDDLTEAQMIKLMVGREVSAIYPPAQSEAGEVVLSVKGLGCVASGVSGVDLELRAGEIVGLAGMVGAGRTELARVLFGITPADEGRIFLNGKELTILNPREAIAQGIAYVPEDRRLHGVVLEMPISENITMASHSGLFPVGVLKFKAETEVAKIFIRNLGVKASGPDAAGGSLSGGNQQKVSVARWLATEPKLLILDEPTQGVDVGAKSEIHRIIRELAKEGLAVLMISSDLAEVVGMSDRVAVMSGGSIAGILEKEAIDAHDIMELALSGGEVER